MSHRVRTTASVRSLISTYEVKAYCDQLEHRQEFDLAIGRSMSQFAFLLPAGDDRDAAIVEFICRCLENHPSIEEHLRNKFTLPEGWAEDETNWDQYRRAIAVTLVQAYYDALPDPTT